MERGIGYYIRVEHGNGTFIFVVNIQVAYVIRVGINITAMLPYG